MTGSQPAVASFGFLVRFAVLSSVAFLVVLPLGGCSEKQELAVKSIHPIRGPYIGGDPVTITGTGFSPTQDITIYFGKNKAKPPVIKEGGEIVVDPPAGELNSTVDVELVFGDARILRIPKSYTYIDPTATAPAPGTAAPAPAPAK
jgi:hypothetical protein